MKKKILLDVNENHNNSQVSMISIEKTLYVITSILYLTLYFIFFAFKRWH